jgi:nucleotide-binding universal stress UspA family protein
MKTIIVATDFGDIAKNAVNYAKDLSVVMGYNLTIVHIVPFIIPTSEVPSPITANGTLLGNAEKKLKILRDEIAASVNAISITYAVREGNFIHELSQLCEKTNTYAIVMGTEDTSGIDRLIFGNKTISAIKELLWPLIVVPGETKFNNIQKIGLACDFKDVVETIPVEEITALIQKFNATLHVIHVSEEDSNNYTPEEVEESGWLHQLLSNLNPKYHFLRGNKIEQLITEFTIENNLDLLIIIPKEHDFLSKLLNQSHSKKLVLQAHVPIMAIHE